MRRAGNDLEGILSIRTNSGLASLLLILRKRIISSSGYLQMQLILKLCEAFNKPSHNKRVRFGLALTKFIFNL
jgi:hypothetical protein